ncbi:MAG: hypothetical protein KAQ94_03180 [Arcobacteraceae bacterium]|nr:hypothetical protein [Arcobacteraceae bacterium]
MIKKISIIFVFFILLVIILFSTSSFEQSTVVVQNNHTKQPISITPDKYKDRFCNMTIKDVTYSAQVVLENEDTLFFDDIGCLVLWLQEQSKTSLEKDKIVLWVWAKDENKYIDARQAWYSLTERTPMHYGFGAYKTKQNNYINFATMTNKMLQSHTMANPKIRKELLGNN